MSAALQPRAEEFAFSAQDFAHIAKLVYATSGIVLGEQKRAMVYSRLARRLRALNLQTFRQYCDLVDGPQGATEMEKLINAITTNLTRFFREPHHFDHLAKVVLPGVFADPRRQRQRRLRIWSAGCSSGEEAYSAALVLADALKSRTSWDAKILATDLDTEMVRRGSAATYPRKVIDSIPAPLRAKHCINALGGLEPSFTFSDEVKRLVVFKRLNLLGPWPMKGKFDLIFCRNVLIYFDGPTKSNLVNRYTDLLEPGSWLFLGHSESIVGDSRWLEGIGGTIYRKVG